MAMPPPFKRVREKHNFQSLKLLEFLEILWGTDALQECICPCRFSRALCLDHRLIDDIFFFLTFDFNIGNEQCSILVLIAIHC